MKKLFLLGLLSFGLLLPFGVNAEENSTTVDSVEGNNSANATVTVGEVEVPVYDVDITWASLKYNWKYNYKTNEYEWVVETTKICESATEYDYVVSSEEDFEFYKTDLYTDSTCETSVSQDLTYEEFSANIENYYFHDGYYDNNFIVISDYSTGSRITPSIKWTSEEKYDFVQGHFKYLAYEPVCELVDEEDFEYLKEYGEPIYTNSNCTTEFEYNEETQYTEELYAFLSTEETFIDMVTEEIDDNARHYFAGGVEEPYYEYGAYYALILDLTNKEKTTITPNAGDTIGTITITINAYE